MKQKRLLPAILAMALMVPAWAQRDKSTLKNPDEATYSIKGTMQVNNGKRYLNDATGNKIVFESVPSRLAKPTQMADLVVRFDNVETVPPGLMKGSDGKPRMLDFWRYDEEVGEWVYDSEVRQGENQMESTMKTNIMLVVDNSKSLGDDFKKVQDAALEFVGRLYEESKGRDIFRIGVIGFSTVQFTKIRDISPLDAANYRQIVNFIRNLEMQNGTAFYYSLEKALDMLENDARSNIAKDEYKESRIYAFTDGLDQASVDDARNLSTPAQYYEHIRPMMKDSKRKKIMDLPGKTVHSTIVTVRGGDMTDKQEGLFDQRAQEICDNVRKLTDMNQLVREFQKLAEDLVNSNYVLYCYIPVGANGRVGWTFAEEKAVKERKPVKLWLGVGVELGDSYDYDYEYHEFYKGLNLNIAFPVTSRLSLGFSAGVGDCDGFFSGYGGLLAKINTKGKSALLLGGGLMSLGTFLQYYGQLGWKFQSPWYISCSGFYGETYGVLIGIGYSILGGR